MISRKTDSLPLAFLPMSEKSPGPLLIVAETDREKERESVILGKRERERGEEAKMKMRRALLCLFSWWQVCALINGCHCLLLPRLFPTVGFQYSKPQVLLSASSLLDLWN